MILYEPFVSVDPINPPPPPNGRTVWSTGSRLTIEPVRAELAGNYTCAPASGVAPASIILHVTDGGVGAAAVHVVSSAPELRQSAGSADLVIAALVATAAFWTGLIS